jgi:ABC-2 type transport system permease protein
VSEGRVGAVAASVPSAAGTLLALVGHVMRGQARSVAVWGLSLGALSAITVASFPSLAQGPQINNLIESYPPEMREMFGIREGTDLSTIEGFLASQIFSFLVPLALAFFPILALSNAIAGAEERGTLDVLLGNPIARWQLVVGNAAATALSLLEILLLLGLATWLPARLLDVDLSVATTAEAVFNLWPTCMFFGALAMAVSAVVHRRVLAVALPGAVLVAMYFANALGNLVEELEDLQPLTIFYHYGSAIEDGIDWPSFAGVGAAALLLLLLAVVLFRRRDVYA